MRPLQEAQAEHNSSVAVTISQKDLQQLISVEATQEINANRCPEPASATSLDNIMLHQAGIQNELSTNESYSNPQNRLGQLIESLTATQHSEIPHQNHSQYGWVQRGSQDSNQNKSQYGKGQRSRSILHFSGNSQ